MSQPPVKLPPGKTHQIRCLQWLRMSTNPLARWPILCSPWISGYNIFTLNPGRLLMANFTAKRVRKVLRTLSMLQTTMTTTLTRSLKPFVVQQLKTPPRTNHVLNSSKRWMSKQTTMTYCCWKSQKIYSTQMKRLWRLTNSLQPLQTASGPKNCRTQSSRISWWNICALQTVSLSQHRRSTLKSGIKWPTQWNNMTWGPAQRRKHLALSVLSSANLWSCC